MTRERVTTVERDARIDAIGQDDSYIEQQANLAPACRRTPRWLSRRAVGAAPSRRARHTKEKGHRWPD
jgi:hypothetical protein